MEAILDTIIDYVEPPKVSIQNLIKKKKKRLVKEKSFKCLFPNKKVILILAKL